MVDEFNKMQALCAEGDTLAEARRWDEAIIRYNGAEQILNKGDVYLTYESLEEALSSIYRNRGNAHAALKNDEAAIADYQKCNKHFDVLYNWGNSLFRSGHFEEARERFSQAYEQKQNDHAQRALCNCAIMLGEFDQAKKHSDDEIVNLLLDFISPLKQLEIYTENTGHTWRLNVIVEDPVDPRTFVINGNTGNVGNSPSGMQSGYGGSGYAGYPPISVRVLNQSAEYATGESNGTCFMAMAFGHQQLDLIVSKHIKPSIIEKFNIAVVTSNDLSQAGSIDQIIRDGIRNSKFVIADLTHSNNGAYWEAGFAEGAGIPVIYTCREDVFQAESTHFDVNHQTTVLWSIDGLGEFDTKLIEVVQNTIQSQEKV